MVNLVVNKNFEPKKQKLLKIFAYYGLNWFACLKQIVLGCIVSSVFLWLVACSSLGSPSVVLAGDATMILSTPTSESGATAPVITATPTPNLDTIAFQAPFEEATAEGKALAEEEEFSELLPEGLSESNEAFTPLEEMESTVNTLETNQIADFEGEVMDKINAAKFFTEGKEVSVIGVGPDYFDAILKDGNKIRVLSPVKPKFYKRYINEYGLSDVKITNGFEIGYEGVLKSSQAPMANMGVGPHVIDVTPMASDGILVEEVAPLFTLYTSPVVGPNDYLIEEEMDYDPKDEASSRNKRWFEIFRGLTKGKIWTIFEQSNRYFTTVDKREWDRMTPGKIFDMMQQFEYLIQIPDRILTIRNPKYLSTEEKFKNRYVLHDYSVKNTSIRLLIPTFNEMEQAITLRKTSQSEDEVSYKFITTVLQDEETGDGEKFTWNNPIKIELVINGKEIIIFMPTQAVIEINGKLYKLPPNLIH